MAVFIILLISDSLAKNPPFMGMEDLVKRKEIMTEMMEEYSIDNSIKISYTDELGIFTTASKNLKDKEITVKIPGKSIMSAFDEFPFKELIIDVLSEIPETANSLIPNRNDFYISTMLLTAQLLVNINWDPDKLISKFPQYTNVPLYKQDWKLWQDYLDTLPSRQNLDHPNQWEKEDLDFFHKIALTRLGYRNIPDFYKKLREVLKEKMTDESEYLLSEVFLSQEQYIWAYNIVNTR